MSDPETEAQAQPDPEKPAPASRNEIAQEVLAGHWSRGQKRVEKLKAAGYDPVKVQEEVNQILRGK